MGEGWERMTTSCSGEKKKSMEKRLSTKYRDIKGKIRIAVVQNVYHRGNLFHNRHVFSEMYAGFFPRREPQHPDGPLGLGLDSPSARRRARSTRCVKKTPNFRGPGKALTFHHSFCFSLAL